MNKQGWEIKKLGEICEILDSQRRPITKKDRQSGSYPYFGATGIQDYVTDYIFDGSFVLVGEDGAKWGANDRTAFLVEGKCWVNNHAHVLKIKEEIIDRWVIYYLNHKDLSEYITGAVVPKLNQASLRNIPIPIPTFSIQEQIVNELDTLSEIIEKKKKQLAELDTLAQATFYEMFGDPIANEKRWESKKIKGFSDIKIGPFGSSLHVEDYVKNGIPLVNPSHMNNGRIIHSLNKTISEKKSKELAAYLLKKDDVVIGRRGEIGRCAIVTEKEEGFICGTGSLFLRFFDYMDPLYFYFVFTSKSIVKNLLNEAKGATMLNLNSKIIGNVNIIVPPLSLQTQFAERVKAIEQQKALIEQSIADVQQLFDSAMDKYFH